MWKPIKSHLISGLSIITYNPSLKSLTKDIKKLADPKRATSSQWFFKTGKGQYGYGDQFVGLNSATQRLLAKKYSHLGFREIETLLKSKIHEERQIGFLILVIQFNRGEQSQKTRIYKFYLDHIDRVNNWDLVDLSADKILGAYLLGKPTGILNKLARSQNLWERRVAIIATYHFIKQNQFAKTLEIAEILLQDKHDLIHKAVGWMLREVGNRSLPTEIKFLKKHYKIMPRTMLRYAIEKFPEKQRKFYMAKN